MDIHRSSIADFILPKIRASFVIDYYEGLHNVLEGREDFPYKNLFANPRHRTQTDITWSSDAFTQKPVLLSRLQGEEKEKYAILLNQCIHAVFGLIDQLKQEEGNSSLCDLLSRSLTCIEEDFVYCGEGKVVLVNWGIIPRRKDIGNGSIFRSGRFISGWDQKHRPIIMEKTISSENRRENIDEQVIISQQNKKAESQPKKEEAKIHERKEVLFTEKVNEPPSLSDDVQSGILSDDLPEEPQEEMETQNVSKETSPEEELSEEVETVGWSEADSEEEEKHDSEKREKRGSGNYLQKLWRWIKAVFRRIMWLLAFLLLLFGILYLFRNCQGPLHKVNPFYNPLPEVPIVLPVEDGEIGTGKDGVSKIATNRFNVLLNQTDKETMLSWAKAFKDIYDGEQYEIVYYNQSLGFLQIRVPEEEREQIMTDLPKQLTGFSFDVFEEILYSHNALVTDPAYQDPDKSWYLKAIGAEDAWAVTMGGDDVIVAVVDNGFDLKHPELSGHLYMPYNVLTRNSFVFPITTREGINAHGTHVAATAVGICNNGQGLLGVAPNCKLMPIQVGNNNADGSMSNLAILDGVMYAINQGADVVNLSLGMPVPDMVKRMSEGQQLNFISHSYLMEEFMWNRIFEAAEKNNCTIVFAAGNDNAISGVDPQKRNRNTIRVSAVDRNLRKADFSNYGVYAQLNREYSTLSAPGVDIYNAAPGNSYATLQGTSMAAPVVTGAVALLKSIDRNLTTERIIYILKATGLHVGQNIGPMIQIGKAVQMLSGSSGMDGNCEQIRQEIFRLRAKIDSLSRICPDAGASPDTLKYSEVIKDKFAFDGVWKATTGLVNERDYSPVELYMTFRNLKGTLTIVNKGREYTAPLTAGIQNGQISIVQHGPAQSGSDLFQPYHYVCFSDRNGYLFCRAFLGQQEIVIFNLVKIR